MNTKSNSYYLPFPSPVFEELFAHCHSHHHNKRKHRTDSGVRREWRERQNRADEEIHIGDPPELLKQCFGNKSCKSELCSSDIIGFILQRSGFKALRVITEDQPWKPRPSNLWMLTIGRWYPKWVGVDFAQMLLFLFTTTHSLQQSLQYPNVFKNRS